MANWAGTQSGARRQIARYGLAVPIVLTALAVAWLLRPFNLERSLLAIAVTALALLTVVLIRTWRRAERSIEREVGERNVELERANRHLEEEIAERTRVEEELRRREEFLTEVQRLSHTRSWISPVPRDPKSISGENFRVVGLDGGNPAPPTAWNWDVVHPDDRERVQKVVTTAISEGKGYEIEHRIILPGGLIRIVQARAQPVVDATGAVTEYVGTSTDVTKRRAAEAEMRKSGLLTVDSDFKGYRILSKVGAGSFGVVYKARRLSTGQVVAIKILRDPEQWSGEDAGRQRERFRREMYLCTHLSHPHIVRLIDHSDESDPILYAAFDHLSGDTLEKILAEEGALDPGEAIRLLGQVLDALACAHERSIVHRDLKPANIMITKTGARRNAMVLDFGLGGFVEGHRREAATRLTMSREMLGTPAYAAPEQLRGEVPTARCDLYSWGLIFLECVTGHSAFEGMSFEELIYRQLGPDPVPTPEPIAKGPLGPLFASVIAKDPLRRPRSATEVLCELESLGTAARVM